jgi:hypothetical protein
MVLRFYDDHEGRWDEWLRPKLIGNIEPGGTGSVLRYRMKLRPFWLPPVAFSCAGVAAFAVGLYGLGQSHGSTSAAIAGLVFAALGPVFLFSLAAGATKSSGELEGWLAERCNRQEMTSSLISARAAWYPDPHTEGWRYWTGYAWAAHASAPIPPIAPGP